MRVRSIAHPDSDARALYRASLGVHGWIVEEAVDGTQALAKALSQCPKLIVIDTHLTIIDGYTLCELLRTDAKTHRVPVLFLTATSPAQIDRARLAGADAVLAKPCLPERLLLEMDWVIEHIEGYGSSGWIRTSNPPVNSNHGASAPSLSTETCGDGVSDAIVAMTRCGKLRPNLRTGAFLPV